MAPNAKLSFADLSKGGSGLCIPPVSQLYTPAYNLGARVFSNSWGTYFSGAGYYSGQDIDSYLYKTASVAIFFAAGNAGGKWTRGSNCNRGILTQKYNLCGIKRNNTW